MTAFPLGNERIPRRGRKLVLFALCALLAACGGGGGGGGSSPLPSGGGSTATPTPTPTPTSSVASASGTVVDYQTNAPLAGVKVSIAAYTKGAAATQVATTDANGAFSFTATPATYLLTIGSDSATDTTATLHQTITLKAGSNALSGLVPGAASGVTPLPSQTSGNFRLMNMSAMPAVNSVLACFTPFNQGRASANVPAAIPDEYLLENTLMINQQEEATSGSYVNQIPTDPAVVGPFVQASVNGAGAGTGIPCSAWTDTFDFTTTTPEYAYSVNPANVWYGVSFSNPNQYGVQMWGADPRP